MNRNIFAVVKSPLHVVIKLTEGETTKEYNLVGFKRDEIINALQNAIVLSENKKFYIESSTDPVCFWAVAKTNGVEDFRLSAYSDEEVNSCKKLLAKYGYTEA